MAEYNPDEDPGSGGSHHQPVAPSPYNPADDPAAGGGGNQAQTQDQPGFMQRTMRTIVGIPEGLWDLGKGVATAVAHPVDTAEARNAGLIRGGRDFTDRFAQYGNPEYGVPIPSADERDAIGQQNAADRAAFDAKYGNDPVANAGRTVGNMVMTAPITSAVTGPLGIGLNAATKLLPAFLTRGVPGAIVNAGERAVTGGAGGGTQAALTADPSKPLGPQIEAGVTAGAVLPAATGAVLDPVSSAISRLRGDTIRANPRLGGLPQDQLERATQADELVKAGVPVMGSQVSNDPLLQTSSKYGGAILGSGMPDFMENQLEKYRGVVMKQAGDTSGNTLVNDAYKTDADTRIRGLYGSSIDSIGAVPAGTLGPDLNSIRSGISPALTAEDRARVNATINHVQDTFNKGGGSIAGKDYQTLARSLSPLFNSTEPDVRAIGWQLKSQLDNRARSVMTNDQINAFDAANDQYRADKTLRAVARSDGTFDPGDLHAETGRVNDNYGGGKSPGVLDRIAQTGNTVIQPTIESKFGTTGRSVATGIGSAGAAAIPMAVALKLATIDALTTGGTGLLGLGIGAGGNRIIQAGNYGGGPRAIAAAGRGGGPPSPGELQQALQLLRPITRAAVSQSVQQQNAAP